MVSFTCLRSRYYDILILQLFTFNFFNSHVLPDDGRTASRNVQPNILYIHICVCVCVCVWMDGWMDGWVDGWMDGKSGVVFGLYYWPCFHYNKKGMNRLKITPR